MNIKAAQTVITLLYAAVALGTIVQPQFGSPAWAAWSFAFCLAASAALSLWAHLLRVQDSKPMAFGYVAAQLLLFFLLHRLPVPHGMLWLVAMPVVSHATFFLRWPAIATTILLYTGVCLWGDGYGPSSTGEILRQALSFGAGCLFTCIFTHVTDASIKAREETRRLAEELAKANERLRESAERDQRHAATSERNRIARDIHDGLGHHLTTIAVQLEATRALMPGDPAEAARTLAKAERQAREALEDVRRSVRTLRSEESVPELREIVAGLIGESGLDARFEEEGSPRKLAAAETQALFRAAQEALTNVRKHAGAARVDVSLRYLADSTEVVVSDDGRGASVCKGGFGLAGLRERLEALGGSLEAGNRAEGGYRLKARVPLRKV